jgi:uncharacterized protein (TIGR02145 family)
MKKSFLKGLFLSMLFTGILWSSCEKREFEAKPGVVTGEVSAITSKSANVKGTIIDLGGGITDHGHCWSTGQRPSITNEKTSLGKANALNNFTSELVNLESGVMYYVRAYVTDGDETIYAEEISFTTLDCGVSTSEVSDITVYTAKCGGNITDDGGAAITARGVCWSTSPNPTVNDNKTSDGSGTGSFTSTLTELHVNTTYYVCAYATNSFGTTYGNERSFYVLPACGEDFTDTRDSIAYKTVKISNQCWMAENLAYLPKVYPSLYENYGVPYYYVYGYQGYSVSSAKATTNYSTYGVLYNLDAALEACPAGWHLPSDDEWKELEMFLGMSKSEADGYGYRRTDEEGGKLKENGLAHWWGPNTDANNESGFTALPGGYRFYDGSFQNIGGIGSWWSSTEDTYTSDRAMNRELLYSFRGVARFSFLRTTGFSVRCIRD